jgi:hypothetical protein
MRRSDNKFLCDDAIAKNELNSLLLSFVGAELSVIYDFLRQKQARERLELWK